MVASYTQLLEQRYGDALEGDAREFMDFVVDGATRMRGLITDLLEFSRVSTRGKELEEVGAQGALGQAVSNLFPLIQDSGALVTNDDLPSVMADSGQLARVFQNLIGNAIKFRGKKMPRIHTGAEQEGASWRFSVADNGIGIREEYFNRIFQIFQRLHGRGKYEGTGIGLAVCKRIVERHGGKLWCESEEGVGTTFFFTLPAAVRGAAGPVQA